MSDTFKRWRDVNNIEKLKEKLTEQQKESVLKVLENLLRSSKQLQVREIINKFRLNRRIV